MKKATVDLFTRIFSVLAPPPNMTVSQWADKYRRLSSESSAEPGRWRTSKAPYQREIMDAVCDMRVQKVVIMSAAQIGKTDALILNPIGYYMHYDPSPIIPGQINQPIDVFPYYESVENITESAGGADRESDAAFYCTNHRYNKQAARTAMIRAAADKNPPVYGFDCVCLIKGVLWGWSGNAAKPYGGAAYASNGVPDLGADTMITKCSGVSADFGGIVPGEAVWLPGHIGVYIGGGKVIECSPAFKNCVQVTACLNIGAISGMNGRKWTKHGKLPYITYDTAGGAQDGAGSTTKPSGTTTTPATLAFAVGDVVRFTGNTHYTNAAAASGAACKPGTAKVTALARGAKHPYHLIKQPGGGSTVYGWVNAADVQAVGSGATAPKMRVGAKVKYSGPLYRDSNGGGQGKTVNGTYTVKYYYPGRKCGVHIDGLGWVPESGCTVIS